jgi:predicted nucleic acid-binding Zn ribbon protein
MERIGREVEETLSRTGARQAPALARITSAWPRAVGDSIARNAWPLRLARDGTLHVATSSSTWACELERLASDIAVKLEAALGADAPPRLRFRVGPIPESGAPSQEEAPGAREASTVTPEATAAADAAAAELADPELREKVKKAVEASLSRRASDRGFW